MMWTVRTHWRPAKRVRQFCRDGVSRDDRTPPHDRAPVIVVCSIPADKSLLRRLQLFRTMERFALFCGGRDAYEQAPIGPPSLVCGKTFWQP
jgi:hypothetical protein